MEPHATALLVDNDPTIADVLRRALAGEPLTLDVAYDLPTAIRCLDSGRYSGLVLDMGLPLGSGFDVLRHMTSRGITLPTVVISKKLPDSVRALLGREHVKLVLPKPVEMFLLVSVILGLCGLVSVNDVGKRRRDRRRAPPDELRDTDLLWRRL
jgi:DNA-binding response OmpR family regulator